MSIYIASYRLTGISPLLMNNPDSMQKPAEGVTKKKVLSPEDEAAAKTYRLENGQLYLKSQAIRSALLGGCAGRRLGNSKVGARTVVAGAVFCTAVECPLIDPVTGKPVKDYVVNTMRAVVQGNGIRRSRPEVGAWACDVDFEVDGDFIADANLLTELLNIAGRTRGVGDYRPEKMGPYGRFRAELTNNQLMAAAPAAPPATAKRKGKKAA